MYMHDIRDTHKYASKKVLQLQVTVHNACDTIMLELPIIYTACRHEMHEYIQ